jgi:hypothetical protein
MFSLTEFLAHPLRYRSRGAPQHRPEERPRPEAPARPRAAPPAARGARPYRGWRRTGRIVLIVLGVLLFILILLDVALDRSLGTWAVKRINNELVGYHATVGRVNLQLLALALVLEDARVYQDAHPDPPVLDIPRLRMSIHWRDLLHGRLVADATFDHPTIHANLVQLQEENNDPVSFGQHGWQESLEAIYPLKINTLMVKDAELIYLDASGYRPLHASEVQFSADNIRNVRSSDRNYPSTVHAEGKVFDVGHLTIDGNADFMAEPMPGVSGRIDARQIDLTYFQPLAKQLGLTVKGGMLGGNGMVEVGPHIQAVDLDQLVISGAKVDYAQGAAPTPLAREAGHEINQAAHTAMNNPEMLYRVKRLIVDHGEVGVVDETATPPFRIFCSDAVLEVNNLSSRAQDGPAKATLTGGFMGSGAVDGQAIFYPEGKNANFWMKMQIVDTQLTSLNQLLRAKGKFDVTEGTLSVYSEVRVKNGLIDGYVKPLFKDIKVYDKEQDKDKNVFRKMYEGIVGGVAHLLENHQGKVATVTNLRGPVDDPNANTMQVVYGLIRNAFIKAILPGFQNELSKISPTAARTQTKEEHQQEKQEKRDKKQEKMEKKQKKELKQQEKENGKPDKPDDGSGG